MVEEADGSGKESVWPAVLPQDVLALVRGVIGAELPQAGSMGLFPANRPARLLVRGWEGGGGGQDAPGLSSGSLTKPGNACFPLGRCLVLAFW